MRTQKRFKVCSHKWPYMWTNHYSWILR